MQRCGLLTKASFVLTGVSGKSQLPGRLGEVLSDHVGGPGKLKSVSVYLGFVLVYSLTCGQSHK